MNCENALTTLAEAMRLRDVGRLRDALKRLREFLAQVDIDKVLTLVEQLAGFLEQIGVLQANDSASAPLAAWHPSLESLCKEIDVEAGKASAQAIGDWFRVALAIYQLLQRLLEKYEPA